ncbi:MAG: hypothetical protein RLY20_908 [Verrucomicrobiota bacterium]|jgi:FkbM family methyltransferase
MNSNSDNNPANGKHLDYVLITPARDEAKFIRKTLEAMVAQTIKPLKWVIVSDGSTDGTDEIVKEYAAKNEWIELLRMPERKERHFGGKVHAFNTGYERVKHLPYHVIGNLDGDSSFEADYLEYLLGKFAENPRLGVAGTNYIEDEWSKNLKHDYRFSNIQDVTGQCQLFRRECFEAFGGYKPSKNGGVDLMASIAGRMYGWETRVFTDKILFHHRQQGTAQFGKYTVEYSNGRKDYMFGSHPLWAFCRYLYRMTKKPYVLGGLLLFAGYFGAMIRRLPRVVTPEMLEFRREEQMQRLGRIFYRLLFLRDSDSDQAPTVPSPQARSDWALGGMVSPHYFTFPFYIPRTIRLVADWPFYFWNYLLRRNRPTEYRLRSGTSIKDDSGALTGTMAVVFIRREYGSARGLKTVLDIGANMGCYALYAADAGPEAKIYCYEPEQKNFEQLKQNVAHNKLEARIATINCAVAGNSGDRDLAVGDALLNSFHIIPTHARNQRVSCVTIREIIKAHKLEAIDMLKMNCEGAEYEILESCTPEEFEHIRRIRLEYHNLGQPGRDGESLARLLESKGYRIERFSIYRGGSGFIWATRTVAAAPVNTSGLGSRVMGLLVGKSVVACTMEMISSW